MVKGVNRQIIEVKNPDGEYFDRALLFLKAGSQVPPADKLPRLAREYVRSAETGENDSSDTPTLPDFVNEYAKRTRRLETCDKASCRGVCRFMRLLRGSIDCLYKNVISILSNIHSKNTFLCVQYVV